MARIGGLIAVYDGGVGLSYWLWMLLFVACMSTLSLALMARSKGTGKRLAGEESSTAKKAIGKKKAKPSKDKGQASKDKGEASNKGENDEKKIRSIKGGCQR